MKNRLNRREMLAAGVAVLMVSRASLADGSKPMDKPDDLGKAHLRVARIRDHSRPNRHADVDDLHASVTKAWRVRLKARDETGGRMNREHYDLIVIGAGSAARDGANKALKDYGARVALVEEAGPQGRAGRDRGELAGVLPAGRRRVEACGGSTRGAGVRAG